MTDDEALAITNRASEILKHWTRPVVLELDINTTIGLIGVCQLALRHPATDSSPTSQRIRQLILSLINHIDPNPESDLHRVLMFGFDPRWDDLDERTKTPDEPQFAERPDS